VTYNAKPAIFTLLSSAGLLSVTLAWAAPPTESMPVPTPAGAQPAEASATQGQSVASVVTEKPATVEPTQTPVSSRSVAGPASVTQPSIPSESRGDPPKNTDSGAPATLFGANPKLDGYGALGVMYTRFAGRDAAQLCGEGGLSIDRTLTLGLAGCGIARTIKTTKLDPTADLLDRTAFGYGGVVMRYHFFSQKVYNLSLGAVIGAGMVVSDDWNQHHNDRGDSDGPNHVDWVFIVEPQIGGYVNVLRWLRLGATVGYRFVSGVDTKGLSESDLAAPAVGLQAQVGWL
jgi:hypothetical protein